LLFLNGQDWRRERLAERRSRLDGLVGNNPRSALQFNDHFVGDGAEIFKHACAMGLEGIVSKRAAAPYRSGPSKVWLKIKNIVESELILLGTDYDNEGKPIAYLGREAEGELHFAGTAFLTVVGKARDDLQKRINKLLTERPPVPQRTWRRPQWVKPELLVRVRHLAGGDTLRHASVQGLAE
jgi:bifunctional non-homologous end joining protein LigD